jgi:membrane protein
MNSIWHTKRGRSIFRKTMDYLALLILLPISINVALAGDAILASPTILAHLHTVIPSAWAVKMVLKFLPFLFVILTLMVMYMFFPNVRVKTYAAFAGAVFAGIFWFLVQKAYIILQIGVSKYNAIYGSFATVPLFLIWVQLGWTFILLGASLAYAVQNRNQYYLPGSGASPQRNLQLAFDILNTIYTNFAAKNATTFDQLILANPSDQPANIQEITEKLIKGGMVHNTDESNPAYVPAAPSEIFEAREVVQLILGHETIPTVGGEFSQEVIRAAEAAIPLEAFPAISPTGPLRKDAVRIEVNDEEAL